MEGAGHPVCIQAYSRSFVTNYTRLALRFLLSLSLFRLMGKEVPVAEFRDVRQWLVSSICRRSVFIYSGWESGCFAGW